MNQLIEDGEPTVDLIFTIKGVPKALWNTYNQSNIEASQEEFGYPVSMPTNPVFQCSEIKVSNFIELSALFLTEYTKMMVEAHLNKTHSL